MIRDQEQLDAADAFVASYEPADGDHPDLASRVANYKAVTEAGNDPARQIHARTLMRFVGNLGLLDEDQVDDEASSNGEEQVLRGAALDEALEAAGLSKSGTADEKRARLVEYQATGG